MSTRYKKLSSDIEDFFCSAGRNSIRLSTSAAIAVCEQAADHGLLILGIEGGFWLNPGFEARHDSLWSGKSDVLDQTQLRDNNMEAASFVKEAAASTPKGNLPAPNVFILTTKPARLIEVGSFAENLKQ
jgi:Colicin-E5 Imm protein